MIHSTFLINLTKKKSRVLQFWPLQKDYTLALDDIIVFSKHAKAAGMFQNLVWRMMQQIFELSASVYYDVFHTYSSRFNNLSKKFVHFVL